MYCEQGYQKDPRATSFCHQLNHPAWHSPWSTDSHHGKMEFVRHKRAAVYRKKRQQAVIMAALAKIMRNQNRSIVHRIFYRLWWKLAMMNCNNLDWFTGECQRRNISNKNIRYEFLWHSKIIPHFTLEQTQFWICILGRTIDLCILWTYINQYLFQFILYFFGYTGIPS